MNEQAGSTRSILIIDDNKDDVLLLKLAFARNGRDVQTEHVPTGKDGLAFLRASTRLPDLVLLDISMPGMNGFEVLRSLRRDDRLRSLPVIIVSHSGLVSDVMTSFESGATAYLQKAPDFEKFVEDVGLVLDRVTRQ